MHDVEVTALIYAAFNGGIFYTGSCSAALSGILCIADDEWRDLHCWS